MWDQGIGGALTVYHANYIGGTSLTIIGCTSGRTYNFVIAAINSIGTSVASYVFSILAATVPDPPINLIKDEENTNET